MFSLWTLETEKEMLDMVLEGQVLDFESEPWPQRSDSAKDLVRKMLCSQPSERLTAKEVRSTHFLSLIVIADVNQ